MVELEKVIVPPGVTFVTAQRKLPGEPSSRVWVTTTGAPTAVVALTSALPGALTQRAAVTQADELPRFVGDRFARTELYFGTAKSDGGPPVSEDSFLVILLYPDETRRESSKKIEQLRKDYKEQFGQESVLRSDFCCERVGF